MDEIFLIISSCSLLDSSHGGSYGMDHGMTPLDQQHQYFGTVNFPVTEETEAWKEKVSTWKLHKVRSQYQDGALATKNKSITIQLKAV